MRIGFTEKRQRVKLREMGSGKQLAILLSTIVASLTFAEGFPDGAPVDACVKPRPNQPYHGQAKPQPLATNPYAVIASAEQFQPGAQITGMYPRDTNKIPYLQKHLTLIFSFCTFLSRKRIFSSSLGP